jgi:hypothetical protein
VNPDNYGLIEMALSFGVVLVFGFWQLYSLRKSRPDTKPPADTSERNDG